MKKKFLILIIFAFSSALMGSEFTADKRLEASCFEKAHYESLWTKELFSDQYHFNPIFFDLFQVDNLKQKVNFTNNLNLIKNSELRSVSHAFLMLNDWLQLKCFSEDQEAQKIVKNLREEIFKKLTLIYPNLSLNDQLSLLYLTPWYEQFGWPYKSSNANNRFELLKETYSEESAAIINRVYNTTQVAIYVRPENRNDTSWLANILSTFEKEFTRFNQGEIGRLKRVLPTFEIVSIYKKPETESGESGFPNYQGIKIEASVNINSAALAWLIWHEAGHVFDKTSPHNSDYIVPNFCSIPIEAAQNSSVLDSSDYERIGVLKSFGRYSDFFTSEFSPDEYRRTKNFELVSYQCNQSDNEWSESLRQSHYNREALEQIADDFAHFVMYPARYFFDNEVVAPLSFKFFEKNLQTNYLSSYATVFQNTSLYSSELNRSRVLRIIWSKAATLNDKELHDKVSAFFKLRSGLMTNPIN